MSGVKRDRYILILLLNLVIAVPTAFAQDFILENGIVKCDQAQVGDSASIDGVTYIKIDSKDSLQVHGGPVSADRACISGVTDIGEWFYEKDFNKDIGHWDVSSVTRMYALFSYSPFNQDIGNWDVSNVTNMNSLFKAAISFNQDISSWNVSNVYDMAFMFEKARAFDQPIGSWNVSNVTKMQGMFEDARIFNQPIGNWDVSKVRNMSNMFKRTTFNQPIGDWNTGSVTTMYQMFFENQVFNQPIGSWDVSNVTNMQQMFQGVQVRIDEYTDDGLVGSQFNQDIGSWDVSSVTTMKEMFREAHMFDQDISGWDVSSVTTFMSMFHKAFNFNHSIDMWNVSNTTDFRYMFSYSIDFNQSLSSWDVSNATMMTAMFDHTWNYSQDLSMWCVPNISTEPTNFRRNSALTDTEMPNWGASCPVSQVVLSAPADGATDQALTPSLSWQADAEATGYRLEVSTDDFATALHSYEGAATSFTLDSLAHETTYSWRVRATNDAGDGQWSESWSFTTEGNPYDPNFSLSNGIIKCQNASPGSIGIVNGTEYTKITDKSELVVHGGDVSADQACTSGITNMEAWFKGKGDFNSDISHWDVSNVTNFHQTFFNASSFNVDIGNWDVSSAQTMASMFDRATSFNRDISGWDVSNVTDMDRMFAKTSFNHDIGNWDVSSVKEMNGMFFTNGVFDHDISQWDVSNVIIMEAMFYGAKEFDQPIGSWDVSNVTNMNGMFSGAISFNQDLSDWNVGKVQGMNGMFRDNNFNSNISTWNTSSVTNMSNMFYENQVFNQPIGSWDVSNVTNMEGMFKGEEVDINDYTQNGSVGSQFNQDISGWDVGNVTTMENMFRDAHNFDQDLSGWDVSSVENFQGMFFKAFEFESDIDGWDVSGAENFGYMFVYALGFNHDLPNWDVSNATMMSGMFDMAWNYSQDLSMWCVPLIESEPDNFWRDTELTADKLPNWGASCLASQVVLSAPADGATDQTLTPSLSWQVDAEATGYRLEVSTDDFATALHSYEGAATSHTLDSLAYETTYSWRVRATNDAGDGQWSESWSFTTEAAPITPVSQVVLSAPADGATDQGVTPSLSWQADAEATGYRLEVSTDDFATGLHSYEGAATSYTLDSLAYETTYSWRVRATNDAGDGQWSESWSFTTEAEPITPVSQVVLSAPTNGATDQGVTPSLSWQADAEATGYRLEVSTDDFATALHSYEGTATSFTLDSLNYETTYSWRVRATNDAGDGQWSESWSFTTDAEPITPVSQVVLSAPTNGATEQALTPSLSWQADAEATGYRLEVSTDDFATALHSYEGTATSFTLDSLNYETTYSWRVRATNDAGDGQWSESWSFTTDAEPDSGGSDGDSDNNDDGDSGDNGDTRGGNDSGDGGTDGTGDPTGGDGDDDDSGDNGDTGGGNDSGDGGTDGTGDPTGGDGDSGDDDDSDGDGDSDGNTQDSTQYVGQVTLQSPSNNSTNIAITTTLNWHEDSVASSYDLEITDVSAETTIIDSTGSTSYSLSNLAYETTYSWRVRATNDAGDGQWSESWSFTTEAEPITPVSQVVLSAPTNGATDQGVTPSLSWQADAEATGYRLEVSTDDFATALHSYEGTATSFTLDSLNYETTYSWRVRATNDAGDGQWSEPWSFTTEAAPVNEVEQDSTIIQQVKLQSPAHDEENISIDPILTWEADSNATHYIVQLTQDNFSTILMEVTTDEYAYQVNDLEYTSKYSWRVRAKHDTLIGQWSDAWSFYTETSQIQTSNESWGDGLSVTYTLQQNYPNPFNPTTVIRYALPQASPVRLEVYDMMGRKVSTLVNGTKPAGYHEAVFDASHIGSGAYMYRLTAGEYTQARTLFLVK